MTFDPAVQAFAEEHSFDLSGLPEDQVVALQCAVACHHVVNEGFARLPKSILERDAAVGLLWQLYERCTERVFGALVAFATACPASSEILARAAIEGCATFRYVLQDPHARLASFFRNHIEDAEKQERLWRRAAEKLQGEDRQAHLAACDYRLQGIAAMGVIVGDINHSLVGSAPISRWPNIVQRFENIGEEIDYRTFYARLSAEPHLDAEETIRYVFGQVSGDDVLQALARETIGFSRLMLVTSVALYAQAGKDYSTMYNMIGAAESCASAETRLLNYTDELVAEAGGHSG